MPKIRTALCVICILLGIGCAVAQALQSHWLESITVLLIGLTVGIPFLIGFQTARTSWPMMLLAGLTLVLGIVSIFSGRGFDLKLQEAHTEALNIFIGMDQNSCDSFSEQLYILQKEGVKTCALQNIKDQQDALIELQKVEKFGPGLSLLDSVRSAVAEPTADWCAEAVKATQRLCPEAFASMKAELKSRLLK